MHTHETSEHLEQHQKTVVSMETSRRDTLSTHNKACLLICLIFVLLRKTISHCSVFMSSTVCQHSLSLCLLFAQQCLHLFCLDQRCCSPALLGMLEGLEQELPPRECQNDPLSQSCGSQRNTGRKSMNFTNIQNKKESRRTERS